MTMRTEPATDGLFAPLFLAVAVLFGIFGYYHACSFISTLTGVLSILLAFSGLRSRRRGPLICAAGTLILLFLLVAFVLIPPMK
jgi:hypothetical protein